MEDRLPSLDRLFAEIQFSLTTGLTVSDDWRHRWSPDHIHPDALRWRPEYVDPNARRWRP